MKIVALIPARSGSQRIKDKNILELNGHPLLAYTVSLAVRSGIFTGVYVVTDSEDYALVGRQYGAEVPFIRPSSISGSDSPDIEWLKWVCDKADKISSADAFCILRPTNPLRSLNFLNSGVESFCSSFMHLDSLRCVAPVDGHPGKMWVQQNDLILPLLPFSIDGVPWHSNQKKVLPQVLLQTASLEIVKREVVVSGSLSGVRIKPHFGDFFDNFDINEPEDLDYLNYLVDKGRVSLPVLKKDL